jgi:hypothetical protein
MWHLVLAAKVLPSPNNHVSWVAVALLTCLHWAVCIGLWKLGEKGAGWVGLSFFFAALAADLYEHFLHPSGNNIFMVARGDWTLWFDMSVFLLLALEILGCSIGIWRLRGKLRNAQAAGGVTPTSGKERSCFSSRQFNPAK